MSFQAGNQTSCPRESLDEIFVTGGAGFMDRFHTHVLSLNKDYKIVNYDS